MYLLKLHYSNFDILVCMFYNITLCRYRVRYFGNLSNIDDRVRNISWQTLNLTQTLTLTIILTLTLILTLILTLTLTLNPNPDHIHTYIYTAIYVRRVAEIVYADGMTSAASCQQLVSKKNKPATGNI